MAIDSLEKRLLRQQVIGQYQSSTVTPTLLNSSDRLCKGIVRSVFRDNQQQSSISKQLTSARLDDMRDCTSLSFMFKQITETTHKKTQAIDHMARFLVQDITLTNITQSNIHNTAYLLGYKISHYNALDIDVLDTCHVSMNLKQPKHSSVKFNTVSYTAHAVERILKRFYPDNLFSFLNELESLLYVYLMDDDYNFETVDTQDETQRFQVYIEGIGVIVFAMGNLTTCREDNRRIIVITVIDEDHATQSTRTYGQLRFAPPALNEPIAKYHYLKAIATLKTAYKAPKTEYGHYLMYNDSRRMVG